MTAGTKIPLDRLALVRRTSDGTEHDRASGPELAALLCGIRPQDRSNLFSPEDIALNLNGLAQLLDAIRQHEDMPDYLGPAIYVVDEALRGLAHRVEMLDGKLTRKAPEDFYRLEVTGEVGP